MNRKKVMNELYDSTLITLGAVGVGMITRKAFSDGLATPAKFSVYFKTCGSCRIIKTWI